MRSIVAIAEPGLDPIRHAPPDPPTAGAAAGRPVPVLPADLPIQVGSSAPGPVGRVELNRVPSLEARVSFPPPAGGLGGGSDGRLPMLASAGHPGLGLRSDVASHPAELLKTLTRTPLAPAPVSPGTSVASGSSAVTGPSSSGATAGLLAAAVALIVATGRGMLGLPLEILHGIVPDVPVPPGRASSS